jgi:beta-lactamase regulating signal transducer with metallopeptidase domain
LRLLTPPLITLPAPPFWPRVDQLLIAAVQEMVVACWLAGSLFIASAMFSQGFRFQTRLARLSQCDIEAEQIVARLGAAMKLRSIPAIRFVDSQSTPLVWGLGPACQIVFPRRLWNESPETQREAMLIHELTHIRRGDPWVRLLESVAIIACWWHPVVWLARRGIAESEEILCDREAVSRFSRTPREYAESLLRALDFTAGEIPLAATGLQSGGFTAQRITQIMQGPRYSRRSRLWTAILLLACVPVVLSPAPERDAPRPHAITPSLSVIPGDTGGLPAVSMRDTVARPAAASPVREEA